MKQTVGIVLALALVVLLGSSLFAAEGQQEGKRGKKGQRPKKPSVTRFLPKEVEATLSDEQREKVALLEKEFGPRLEEFAKKRAAILSPEQIKAQNEARKAAAEAGKKGKELQAAIDEAMKLTDDQVKKLAELKKESEPLNKTIREKVVALLTDEQKAQLPKRPEKKAAGEKAKGRGGKKKAAETS
jgi:hypothetical protein